MSKPSCRQCGDRAHNTCGCGAPVCNRHAHYYTDESNAAINRNSRPKCGNCAPPKRARPLTRINAIINSEWSHELDAIA